MLQIRSFVELLDNNAEKGTKDKEDKLIPAPSSIKRSYVTCQE